MSDRRNFLKKVGLLTGGATLANFLSQHIILDQIFKSQLMAAGLDANTNFLNINMGGGPPRYMSDHWLKTSEKDPNPIVSPYSGTCYSYNASGEVTGQLYKTYTVGQHEVPHLYFSLPRNAGTSILENLLIVQGYGSGIDGHGLNSQLQFHPLASAPSFTGNLADESSRPFQAARHPDVSEGKFVSHKNVSINLLNRDAPLNTLLGVLISNNLTRRAASDASVKDVFDTARQALNSSNSGSPFVKIANENLQSGYRLLNSALGDFSVEWQTLYTKYSMLVNSAMRDQFAPGITATLDGSKQLYFVTNDVDGRFDTGTGDGFLTNGSNLIEMCSMAENDSIITGLALAEFVFKHKLVSTLEISGGGIGNLLRSPGINTKDTFELGNDHHGGGGYISNLAMQMYHRGMLAGIAELRSQLISFGVWKNSHIRLSSEFDRKISAKGTGSGHGTEQMVSSLISGKISQGPYLVGNIYNQGPVSEEAVSQGLAAPIAGYSEYRPTPMTMCSTMAAVVSPDKNPWKNIAPPLVGLNPDGTLILPYGRGKVIA